MKKILLALLLLVTFSAPSFAWGPGPHGYRGGWGPGGPAMFWTGFGLTCGAMVLGTAAAYANANRPVYASTTYVSSSPVVYQQPAVIYQQAAPQVVYVQPPQQNVTYIQQPAPQTQYVQQPQPEQQQAAAPAYPQAATQAYQQQAAAPAYPQQQQQAAAPAYQPAPTAQSYAVRIPNANGSTTVIPLTQSGSGWLGPQGEYYPSYPTADQVKARYQQ